MSFRLVMAVSALLVSAAVQAQAPAEKPAEAPTAAVAVQVPAPGAAAAPVEVPAATTAAATTSGDATAGQAKAGVCAACHGLDGNPASSQYPKLAGQHEGYIVRQVGLFKTHKRDSAVMMGFVMALTEQDMHDIGAYFSSKTSLPGVADTKLVARGEALYRGGDAQSGVPACMACHGPDGRGNPGAGYPQLAAQYADYLTLKLKDWHDGKTWGDDERAKVMPAVVKGLADADITALASYIEGLHAADAGATSAAK
jgi:cytochrome c553